MAVSEETLNLFGALDYADDYEECNELMHEAKHGRSDTVNELIKSGAVVNEKSGHGMTALMFASKGGYSEIVASLLDAGASVNEKDERGYNALAHSASGRNLNVVSQLIKAGASVNERNQMLKTALILSTNSNREGSFDVVLALINAGASVNEKDFVGRTALMWACSAGCVDQVKVLIRAKATLNDQSSVGHTALMIACQSGYEEIIDLLISAGALLNVKDDDGDTALIQASERGYNSIIDKLISARASLNDAGNLNCTALIHASKKNYCQIVRSLTGARASLDKADVDGNTALIHASRQGYYEIVRLLVEEKASVNAKNDNGMTALLVACEKGNTDIVKLLTEAEGNMINESDDNENTALILACRGGHLSVVKILVRKGAALNVKGEDGCTALMNAVKHRQYDVIVYLLEVGAETELQYLYGNTMIDLAVEMINGADNKSEEELETICRKKEFATNDFMNLMFRSQELPDETLLFHILNVDGGMLTFTHTPKTYAQERFMDNQDALGKAKLYGSVLFGLGVKITEDENKETKRTKLGEFLHKSESINIVEWVMEKTHTQETDELYLLNKNDTPFDTTSKVISLITKEEKKADALKTHSVSPGELQDQCVDLEVELLPKDLERGNKAAEEDRLQLTYKTIGAVERKHHMGDDERQVRTDITKCLIENIGRGQDTLEIINSLDETNQYIEKVKKLWKTISNKVQVAFVQVFVLSCVLYYFDFITDILGAYEVSEDSGAGKVVKLFSWVLAFGPHLWLSWMLFYQRKVILCQGLGKKMKAYMLLRFPFARCLFFSSWKSIFLCVFLFVLQMWPAFVFLQIGLLVLERRNCKNKPKAEIEIAKAIDKLKLQVNVIGEVNTEVEATAQLLLLIIVMHDIWSSTNIILKIILSPFFVASVLLQNEALLEHPVEIGIVGKILLLLFFYFRYAARVWIVSEFIHNFEWFIFVPITIHLFSVVAIRWCLDTIPERKKLIEEMESPSCSTDEGMGQQLQNQSNGLDHDDNSNQSWKCSEGCWIGPCKRTRWDCFNLCRRIFLICCNILKLRCLCCRTCTCSRNQQSSTRQQDSASNGNRSVWKEILNRKTWFSIIHYQPNHPHDSHIPWRCRLIFHIVGIIIDALMFMLVLSSGHKSAESSRFILFQLSPLFLCSSFLFYFLYIRYGHPWKLIIKGW